MKTFALIGAAGFIAPRHMKAIKETGNDLVCALDRFDSVGVIDSYFPNADFFTEFERFDRHVEKKRMSGRPMDYISICSPNYLHDSHIRFGLRNDSDVICEKPIVLNLRNLDSLVELENRSGKKVYNILQLRYHKAILELKRKVESTTADHVFQIDLTYITSRGNWYYTSWKGDVQKSGGIATNIGVHFFDMLIWIFGNVQQNIVHLHEHDRAAGLLVLKRARVRWFLSIEQITIPQEILESGKKTFRSLTIDGESFEFSDGFTDLHTVCYENIIRGEGFGLNDCRPSIEAVQHIRSEKPVGLIGDYHPFVKLPLKKHPFL